VIKLTSESDNPFIYTIPNEKVDKEHVDNDFNMIPITNAIYALEHSAEVVLKDIYDPQGRIKKLIIPNIEGLPEESIFFNQRRLTQLKQIDVPFLIR
jgi:hypothetical protein